VDIAAWLHGLGLQQYEQAFCDNAIDAVVLPELTAEDLKDLGVTMVHDYDVGTLFAKGPPNASGSSALIPKPPAREF
jgi:hypothetical protein